MFTATGLVTGKFIKFSVACAGMRCNSGTAALHWQCISCQLALRGCTLNALPPSPARALSLQAGTAAGSGTRHELAPHRRLPRARGSPSPAPILLIDCMLVRGGPLGGVAPDSRKRGGRG